MKKPYYLCIMLLLLFLCCKKPYQVKESIPQNSFLVVEGNIDSGKDSTIISLSKTVNLNNKTTANPVLGATVTVESDQNTIYRLTDVSNNGKYAAAALQLPTAAKYRLHIKTSGGVEYLSDFITIKNTPPIDSIGFNIQNNNMNVYVNTHDITNSTRYYRWDYAETWQFHSKYQSGFVLDNTTNTIVLRNVNQQVYYCYANDISSTLLLKSTKSLAQDVVYQSSLTQIPLTSEKIESKYSILLKQYALTEEAFNFYQNLKKNTELTGSIFDAQPSQLGGNIHCVNNPKEEVIGYVTATNVQTKRVFISADQLHSSILPIYPYDCEEDTALYKNKQGYNDVQNTLINPPLTAIPISAIFDKSGHILGYLYSSPLCVDCTLRGTKQTPSFWQ